MKVITIGRDPSCNIVINDPKISRRHAIIRISDFGKIEVVDLSTNGTSVNGNPLRKNVPYPVTRNNQVTFAGVSKLNWDDVPNPFKLYKWIAIGIAGLIALAIGITAIVNAVGSEPDPVIPQEPPAATATTPETAGKPKISSKAGSNEKNKAGEQNDENLDDNTGSLLKPVVSPHRTATKTEAPANVDKKEQNSKPEKTKPEKVNNKPNNKPVSGKPQNQTGGKPVQKPQNTDSKQGNTNGGESNGNSGNKGKTRKL